MRLTPLLAAVVLCAALLPPCPAGAQAAPATVVPAAERISDFEARLALGRILSYEPATLAEALRLYDRLLKEAPGHADLRLERVRILVRLGERDRARGELERLLAEGGEDPALLAEAAGLEAEAGRAVRSRALYEQALARAEGEAAAAIAARYADHRQGWGDFAGAEAAYRARLATHPGDAAAALKLAACLASAQRYEEAEGTYRDLLAADPRRIEARTGLARTFLLAGDGRRAADEADRALALDGAHPEALRLKADALMLLREDGPALALYGRLAELPGERLHACLRAGRIALRNGETEAAERWFARAEAADPADPEPRFWRLGRDRARQDGFLASLTEAEASPERLVRWARVYAENGLNEAAIAGYRAALGRDGAHFPSLFGLAETLAVAHRYDEALTRFRALDAALPGTVKIEIALARALAWSKAYPEALARYEALHRQAPSHPLPLREGARTAYWGKRPAEADRLYGLALDPSVDERLLAALPAGAAAEQVRQARDGEKPYRGYEALAAARAAGTPALGAADGRAADEALRRLLPDHRIQKAFALERRAKALQYERHHLRALDAYDALVDFEPGNQEARFDRSQSACALGLRCREAADYRALLNIDPLHNLAALGLERLRIRSHPALAASWRYWHEAGRGDLARMARHEASVALDVPLFSQYRVTVTGHEWFERPTASERAYQAEGFTLEAAGVVNGRLSGGAAWTHRRYRHDPLGRQETGYAALDYRLRDGLTLGARYRRTNEIANEYALRQGVQADAWTLTAAVEPTRRLDLRGDLEYVRYRDDNDGRRAALSLGYALTDHPRTLKVVLSGEYRDTAKENGYRYDGAGRLSDIVHPYWTPKGYTAAGLAWIWRHDLSPLFFCGGDLHYYEIRLSGGTDSESNPAARIEGAWHYEFRNRWTVGLEGLLHRSRQWDGDSLFLVLRRHF